MLDTSDFRRGLKILHEDDPWEVVEFLHVKPGKGQAFVRSKIRNMIAGTVIEKSFRAGEKFPEPDLEYRQMQYLYPEGDNYVLMDMETYDQISFTAEQMGDSAKFITENQDVDVVFFEGRPISVSLPNHIILTVAETEPGVKGDTVSGATKPATLETGAVIQVPLFLSEGEQVKVDTRTGEYIERVS